MSITEFIARDPDLLREGTAPVAQHFRRTWTLREALSIARKTRITDRIAARRDAALAPLPGFRAVHVGQHGPAVYCAGCGRDGRLGIDILGSGAEWLLCGACS